MVADRERTNADDYSVTDHVEGLAVALSDRYTIESELGRGGMAIVYLAQDLKHNRKVAIKVLRPELTASLYADRFLREIETAAALAHPHILPLYDSGTANGSLFYVMPFVAGESLRQRLNRERKLTIEKAIRIAGEVADALDHAHEHGVIHRDIKPENILLEADHAVVADFGIAKAVSLAGGERLTETGMAVGTPTYMSPEQASGVTDIDGRSDVYSLGCVVFEMLGGDPPYMGTTPQAILGRKLAEPVPSVSALRDTVPEALSEVVKKSMAKDPVDRFATAKEFARTLQVALVTPEAAKVVARKRPARSTLVLGAAVVAAALIALVVVIVRTITSGPVTIAAKNIVQVTTEPGIEAQPAISPDGQEVAFVVIEAGIARLAVRGTQNVGRGGGTRPGENVPGPHYFPTWTPDGASVRFLSMRGAGWVEVGKLGGSARRVSDDSLNITAAWSPDGTHVAFAAGDTIVVYSMANGEQRPLGVHTVEPWGLHSLTWSPDGQRIAYVNGNPQWRLSNNVNAASIWVIDINGGAPVQVTDNRSMNVAPQWLPDSRHLLFVSDRDGPTGVYVAEVGLEGPRGSPRGVPGFSSPHTISVSADGKRLAYNSFAGGQNIWSLPIPPTSAVSIRDAVPVTTGSQLIERHSLSPDGDWIVYHSTRRGKADIYKMPLAGGDPTVIVDISEDAFDPDWSPDGSEIAFFTGTTNAEIMVVSADGGTPERLRDTHVRGVNPDWSPDGLAIAYTSATRPYPVWAVFRDSVGAPWNEPIQLTDFQCNGPDWAPDGTSLACRTGSEFVRVSRDGRVVERLPLIGGIAGAAAPLFSTDGSRIFFMGSHEDGSRGVWWMPADGGAPTKVVAFDDPRFITQFHLTVGADNLYLTLAQYESDIWVMDLEW